MEKGGGTGCVTLRMFSVPLNCTPKMGQMVNAILSVFCHNKKTGKNNSCRIENNIIREVTLLILQMKKPRHREADLPSITQLVSGRVKTPCCLLLHYTTF